MTAGVPPSGSGQSGSAPSPDGLGLSATVPNAGGWAVVRRRSFGHYWQHDYAQVDTVKPKIVWVKIGAGRRLNRFSIGDVVPCTSKEAAQQLCQSLEGAKGEAMRRERAAVDAYRSAIGRLYASAIEAAAAGETRSGSTEGESAVRDSGDARPSAPSPTSQQEGQ